MTKETGVPKLKGATNLAIWLFRLERHMTAKGTWEAAKFAPYKQSTRETTPPTPSIAPDGSPQPERESIETPTPSGNTPSGQPKADPKRKPKFGDTKDYPDFDFGLESTQSQDDWVLHPDNAEAINDIVIHCEDIPARKVDGILAARWALDTLIKQYKTNTELQKYLVIERIWTTTYDSCKNMEEYTNKFGILIQDIARHKITIDSMLKQAIIHNLGTHFKSFQERKRDTGIESLSHDTLTSQLHDEELANKSQSKAASLATNTKNSKKQGQGKSPGIGKDHTATSCPWCKREDKKEEDCWFKHPEKATDMKLKF